MNNTENQSPLLKQTKSYRYAIGMFGTSIPINMFKTFAAAFYVDMLGLDMKMMSKVIFIYTFLDAIDNPVYGYLSDHTRSRFGRRRIWLLVGAPLLIVAFLLFYNVPSGIADNKQALYYYLLLTYLLTGTLDSLINANYGALFPELFKSDAKRASTNAMRQAFQLVAMGISIALTPMVTGKIGYQKTSLIYGILALAVILFCATGCHEEPISEDMEKPGLLSTLFDLVRNEKFWVFGVTNAFYSAAFALIMQALPFFAKYTLNLDGTQQTIVMASVLIVALVGVALWSLIIKRLKVLPSLRASLLIMSVGFIPMYFVTNMAGAISAAVVIGFGAAGAIATFDVIGAKVIDHDFKLHGIKREGILTSAMGVLNRMSGLYTALTFYIIQEVFLFKNGDEPGPNPAMASRVLFVVFPFAAMLIAFIVSIFMKFADSKNQEKADDAGV